MIETRMGHGVEGGQRVFYVDLIESIYFFNDSIN